MRIPSIYTAESLAEVLEIVLEKSRVKGAPQVDLTVFVQDFKDKYGRPDPGTKKPGLPRAVEVKSATQSHT